MIRNNQFYPASHRAALFLVISCAIVFSLLSNDWIAGLAVCVLWAVWRYLPTSEGPPVLSLALTFQWMQVVIGLFYYAVSGRELPAMQASEYRLMMLIGLGCIVALLFGLRCAIALLSKPRVRDKDSFLLHFSWGALLLSYAASVVLTGFLETVAWRFPQLTQGIFALSFFRYALLYLVFRYLMQGKIRWNWIMTILLGELVLGFTGFFAGFREPVAVAVLAFLEVFDRRKVRHWCALGALLLVVSFSAVLWMGVRIPYRQTFDSEATRLTRLETIASLSSRWLDRAFDTLGSDMDFLLDRLWAIHFPARALSEVPAVLPHENGALMWSALRHLATPRLLFPEKDPLPSDSELVRKYARVWVAGPEQGTSVAFGYAAESYVDFGLPWMFVPVVIFGFIMGLVYQWFWRAIRNRDIRFALITVVFWLVLYLFERSWIKTLGLSLTLIIYLGGLALILDLVFSKRGARRRRDIAVLPAHQ